MCCLLRAKALRTHFVLFARIAFAVLMYTMYRVTMYRPCTRHYVPRPCTRIVVVHHTRFAQQYIVRCTHIYCVLINYSLCSC
jgi:hypothetical protein